MTPFNHIICRSACLHLILPTNRQWPMPLTCKIRRNPPSLRLSPMHQTLHQHRRCTNRHTQCPHNTTIILTLLGILSMDTPLTIQCGALLSDSGKGSGPNSWMVYGQKFPRLIDIYRDHSVMKFEVIYFGPLFYRCFCPLVCRVFALYHSFFGKTVFTVLTKSHTLSKSHSTDK